MRMLRFFVPAILWIILILVLCTLPGKDLPSVSFLDKIHFDKIVHFGMFAGVVVLLGFGYFKNFGRIPRGFITVSVIGASAMGLAIEYIQKYFIANRSFDLYDFLFDTLGALFGALVLRFWLKYQSKKR
ncbi:VanZ like protein [Chitinophaga skermanii]|uniref:VanZ like protein n=1 Tax=Chitinophaga skermanii TaxID=331697 RepID=A0A327QJV0_9BACT|nr:VanZ family protein [Chitinophaga skermanii]RAJ03952.1 VanZ like protein [Chitinophaga skermanii]